MDTTKIDEVKYYYKFLISSIDFKEGKDNIILHEIENTYKILGEFDYSISTIPIQKIGFHDRVDLILECKKPPLEICDLITKYQAERITN